MPWHKRSGPTHSFPEPPSLDFRQLWGRLEQLWVLRYSYQSRRTWVKGSEIHVALAKNAHSRPRWTFIIAAIFGAIGMLLTYFFVPDMTGVDLSVEDEQFFKYLNENGWEPDVAANLNTLATKDTTGGNSENEVL